MKKTNGTEFEFVTDHSTATQERAVRLSKSTSAASSASESTVLRSSPVVNGRRLVRLKFSSRSIINLSTKRGRRIRERERRDADRSRWAANFRVSKTQRLLFGEKRMKRGSGTGPYYSTYHRRRHRTKSKKVKFAGISGKKRAEAKVRPLPRIGVYLKGWLIALKFSPPPPPKKKNV